MIPELHRYSFQTGYEVYYLTNTKSENIKRQVASLSNFTAGSLPAGKNLSPVSSGKT
ncbi:MAG: hypothetical protein ABI472_10845 [Ginsengibacter sp.]